MAPRPSRAQIQALVRAFARESPANRQALIDDPKSVIEQLIGTSLGSLTIKTVRETDDTLLVVVPYELAPDELDSADLDVVTGGAGSVGIVHVRIMNESSGGE